MGQFRVGDIVKIKKSGVYGRIYNIEYDDHYHFMSVEFFSEEEDGCMYREDEIEVASDIPTNLLFLALRAMSRRLAEFEHQMNEEIGHLQYQIDGPDPLEE